MKKRYLAFLLSGVLSCSACASVPSEAITPSVTESLKAEETVIPTLTATPETTITIAPISTVSPIPTETDFFADYNGEKIQRIVSERGDVYTPSMCNDIIFYRADEGETLEEILLAMKTAIMEPLTIPSENRAYTVTAYDVSFQRTLVELEENMWCLPDLEGKYKFDGVDFVAMEDRLEFEKPDENGLIDFLRQGSDALFQFILMKEGNVYRLQRLVRMCEMDPELKKYEVPD